MLRLAGDPALRARLAGDAVSYAGEWGADAMAGKLSRLYAEVASGAQAHRLINTEAQAAAPQE